MLLGVGFVMVVCVFDVMVEVVDLIVVLFVYELLVCLVGDWFVLMVFMFILCMFKDSLEWVGEFEVVGVWYLFYMECLYDDVVVC